MARLDECRIRMINQCIQRMLVVEGLEEVAAVHAADWLDSADRLTDRSEKPGAPLRDLLRAGLIDGSDRKPHGKAVRWFIRRVQ